MLFFFILSHHLGEFSWRFNPSCPNRANALLPDPLEGVSPEHGDLHMVGFWLSEYTIKTLALTALQHNLLNVYITQEHAYESERFLLQTTCESFFQVCMIFSLFIFCFCFFFNTCRAAIYSFYLFRHSVLSPEYFGLISNKRPNLPF